MQVDWLTVIAQIINFIVLVYLLKRFLYGPIVKAMQTREKLIHDRLQSADEREAEAEHEQQSYQARMEELEDRRQEMLEGARQEVHAQRSEQMEALRSEIAATRTRWHEEVEYEKNAFLGKARLEIGSQACDIARHLLQQLASVELEQRIFHHFLQQLEQMAPDERQALRETLPAQDEAIQVSTGFVLNEQQQQQLGAALAKLLGESPALEFVQDEGLVCGLSLQLASHKLAWNIDDALEHMQESLSSLLTVSGAEDPAVTPGEPG